MGRLGTQKMPQKGGKGRGGSEGDRGQELCREKVGFEFLLLFSTYLSIS